MELTIKLKNSYGRLANREPFVITTAEDERYFLNLDSDLRINNVVAVFRRGQEVVEKRYFEPLGEVKQIEIPDTLVKEGVIEVEIKVLSHGLVVATYHVEPIVFARVDTHFEGHAEIEELRQKVAEQDKRIAELLALVDGLHERLKLTETQVREIWEYEEQ